jgi:hypothetical protein
MPTIEVQITSAQNTKLKRNETIQLSYEALTQTNSKATHDAEIDVSDAVYKRVQSAIRRGVGIRIVQGEYEGGSIWKKVKGFAKSKTGRAIGSVAKKVGQKALYYSIDKGVPLAINAGASYLSGGSVLQESSQETKDKMARLRAMRGSGRSVNRFRKLQIPKWVIPLQGCRPKRASGLFRLVFPWRALPSVRQSALQSEAQGLEPP